MYKVSSKTIFNFQDVIEYTSSYQARFNKVVFFLSRTLPYFWASIEAYFRAAMLIKIGTDYLTPVSLIQND